MKKKLFTLGALAAVTLSVTSCRTSEVKSLTKTKFTSETPIVLEPKFVEYEVDFKNKAKGVAEGKVKGRLTAEMYVSKALTLASENSGADFIFEPNISIETRGKNITATVTGHPAKYASLRKVDIKDSLEVAFYQKQQEIAKEVVVTKKKRKKVLIKN